ncbi:hypothetical protein ID866_7675 [Astraeus odoratus]|nr:hypothetical protein ID866_7675 [Astraeus odoratus]
MSGILAYTPIDNIPQIRDDLRATFKSGVTLPLEWRRHQLHQVARLAQIEADAICEAIARDFNKPRFEVIAVEVGPAIQNALKSAEKLEEWAKPEHPAVSESQKSWKPTVYKMPKGTVLIIVPWNAPMFLSFQPLIGAIAAGCCAVVKLSEAVPHFSKLMAELFPKYLDSSAYRIVNGAVPETTKLLELQWDHIFYTGNGKVARIIASAAAKHLTPCSLELGGKGPVFVDSMYDMELAAKRIMWGKCNNAGQESRFNSRDYILISKEKQDELIRGFEKAYKASFPDGALDDSHFASIVNDFHFQRITSLLDRSKGEKVVSVMKGRRNRQRRRLEPVIVKGVKADDSLLEEEIFGPVLPIIAVDGLNEAIEFINERPHPLMLYAFTEDPVAKQRLINETQSGSIIFNDTLQWIHELPFSGVGESGYGYQGLQYTFDAFTHLRSSIDIPKAAETTLSMRYPPQGEQALQLMRGAALKLLIPS